MRLCNHNSNEETNWFVRIGFFVIVMLCITFTLIGCSNDDNTTAIQSLEEINDTFTEAVELRETDEDNDSEDMYYLAGIEEILSKVEAMQLSLDDISERTNENETEEKAYLTNESSESDCDSLKYIDENIELLILKTEEIENDLDDIQNELRYILASQKKLREDYLNTIDNPADLTQEGNQKESETSYTTQEEPTAEDKQIQYTEIFVGDIITIDATEANEEHFYKIYLYSEGLKYSVLESSGDVKISFFSDEAMLISEDIVDGHTLSNVDGYLYMVIIPEKAGMVSILFESYGAE